MYFTVIKKTLMITFLSLAVGSVVQAEEIILSDFQSSSGKCSPTEKSDLIKAFVNENTLSVTPLSYTLEMTVIERRKGSSPPTPTELRPLKTVYCLAKENNKILVAAVDTLDKSCGWVDKSSLAKVESTGSFGKSIDPCGEIKPLSVGDFCQKVKDMQGLDVQTQLLLSGCDITGISDSTIDAKFVTDNTTSRLSSGSTQELVQRKIPVYLNPDSSESSGFVDVFSLTQVFDIKQQKGSNAISILLGVGNTVRGWTEINNGHIWYSNLSTYFDPTGTEKVYLGEIFGGDLDVSNRKVLASKPATSSFNVKNEYVKFPVLFDKRRQEDIGSASLSNFIPQLQIAFIGKLCDRGDASMCTDNENNITSNTKNLKAADIVYLVDGSKSMKKYFKIVAEQLTNYTSEFVGNPDYRFGVAMYGDFKSKDKTAIGDPVDFKIIRKLEPNIMENFQSIENARLFTKDALFDKSEAVHAAVYEAAKSFDWSPDKPHVLIHIADHGDRVPPTQKVFNELLKRDIFYVPIAVEGDEIRLESKIFRNHSAVYAEKYIRPNGDRMATDVIVTYGGSNKKAEDQIAQALIEASNIEVSSSVQEDDAGSGEIFPILSDAVTTIFGLNPDDNVDTLAATGFVKTAAVDEVESNWKYFVSLDKSGLDSVKKSMETVCYRLGSGDDNKTVVNMVLDMVQTLTGDKKSRDELIVMFQSGAIPLQTQTIIGGGINDLMVKIAKNVSLDSDKKEFCRSAALIELMQQNKKLLNPEDRQDLIWAETYFDYENEEKFNWIYDDTAGEARYYLPLEYLPRPLDS